MTPYATVAEATQYLEARGKGTEWAAVADQEAALVEGSDYADQRFRKKTSSGWQSMFSGRKTGGRTQYREWPRDGAVDYYGDEIPDGTIPDEVKYTAIEAALIAGTDSQELFPPTVPGEQGAVTKEKVGPIAVEYADPQQAGSIDAGAEQLPTFPEIQRIIAPLLTGPGAGVYSSGIGFRLVT